MLRQPQTSFPAHCRGNNSYGPSLQTASGRWRALKSSKPRQWVKGWQADALAAVALLVAFTAGLDWALLIAPGGHASTVHCGNRGLIFVVRMGRCHWSHRARLLMAVIDWKLVCLCSKHPSILAWVVSQHDAQFLWQALETKEQEELVGLLASWAQPKHLHLGKQLGGLAGT